MEGLFRPCPDTWDSPLTDNEIFVTNNSSYATDTKGKDYNYILWIFVSFYIMYDYNYNSTRFIVSLFRTTYGCLSEEDF